MRKTAIGASVLAFALFATSASARDSGFRGGPRRASDAKSAAAANGDQSAAATKVSKEVPAAKATSPAAKTPAL